METKTCPECKEVFPATPEFFYRTRDGLRGKCKKCFDAYRKEWMSRDGNKQRINSTKKHVAKVVDFYMRDLGPQDY
jgi:hypothetical protein